MGIVAVARERSRSLGWRDTYMWPGLSKVGDVWRGRFSYHYGLDDSRWAREGIGSQYTRKPVVAVVYLCDPPNWREFREVWVTGDGATYRRVA
jgi:hypothetical protein